jgi:putative selenium metabolism hydrolase
MFERVKTIAAEIYPQYLDFCQRIIQTPSESSHEENAAQLYYDELIQLGYDEVFKDDYGNVIGVIRGTEDGPVIMYNGHFDVVPTGDVSIWDEEPFGARIKEALMPDRYNKTEENAEVICGRGTGDMKCGGAAQIYAGAVLLKLREEGHPVKGTFLIAQVGVEEYGEALGTIKLAEYFVQHDIKIDAMVCGEPSSLRLMLGHRGRMELRVTVYGQSCHGSSPWLGVNAVVKAAKLIEEVEKAIWSNGNEDADLGRSGIALTMMDIEPCELCIVPNKVNIVYDRRLVPGETVEGAVQEIQDIIDRLAAADPEFKATVEVNANDRDFYTGQTVNIKSQKSAWKIRTEHPFTKACAAGLEAVGTDVAYGYWPFSTDSHVVAVIMNKPVIGFSGAQEYGIHTNFEKTRTDYLAESIACNVSMFLKAAELPLAAFTMAEASIGAKNG